MVTEEELAQMNPEELAEFQKKNCIFCQISSGNVPAKIVYSDDSVIAVLDINPATKGHMLLMPREHHAVLMQVPEDVISHLFMVAKGLSQAALKALQCKGTTIFVANGVAAGQRAPHFMIHIIPRSDNDNVPLNIPVRKIAAKDLTAVKDALLKTFGKKQGKAAIVKETPKKPREKSTLKSEKLPKKKKKAKTAKKKRGSQGSFNLDAVTEMFAQV